MEENLIRALILLGDGWGANVSIDDDAPGILAQFEAMGWNLTLVSSTARPSPCGYAIRAPRTASVRVGKLSGDIKDVDSYDVLIVAPGKNFDALVADAATLNLVRRASEAGLAIGAFCRGARVLAAAGVVSGKTMTGHPDYRAEYEAAGARFIDYTDRAGKSDATPPLVDGFMVTSLRSKYYRTAVCQAIRTATENARRRRASSIHTPASTSVTGKFVAATSSISEDAAMNAGSASFAFMLTPDVVKEARLLVGSLRAWGGALGNAPVFCMVPGKLESIPESTRTWLTGSGCGLVPFRPDARLDALPLATKVRAAAAAERLTRSRSDVLVWLDPDTVIIREPSELLLPAGTVVAATPVHHRLVGLPWHHEPDGYWSALYALCGADPHQNFAVDTIVDREPIWPYFNAGLIVVRPGAGILAAWKDNLASAITDPAVQSALASSGEGHRTFLHQAVLAATIMGRAGGGGFFQLSPGYNYPAHMHSACPPGIAPKKLDDLYTLRYDQWSIAPKPEGYRIPVPGSMKAVLERIVPAC